MAAVVPAPPSISAPAVAREVDQFISSILITIEERMTSALAGEALSIEDAHLLIGLPRDLARVDSDQRRLDKRERGRLRRLVERGLAEMTGDGQPGLAVLSDRGLALLTRLEGARVAAITDLIASLEPAEQLRLQGAMRLVSDRFSSDRGLWV